MQTKFKNKIIYYNIYNVLDATKRPNSIYDLKILYTFRYIKSQSSSCWFTTKNKTKNEYAFFQLEINLFDLLYLQIISRRVTPLKSRPYTNSFKLFLVTNSLITYLQILMTIKRHSYLHY
ncbi:hypothetical protein Hanom_Chr17g01561431 [Helianthus anomalus]